MIFKNFILTVLAFLIASTTSAKPLVVTTLPEFAYLVTAIARDKVEVKSLLTGSENPHFLDVRPDFISKLRSARLICFNGLELEIGWLPKSIEKSTNSLIRPNTAGWCDLGSQINPIDKMTAPVDRSMGDVHAAGNPHYNLSLKQIRLTLTYLTEKLTLISPSNKSFFETNRLKLDQMLEKTDTQFKQVLGKIKTKNGGKLKISQYHKEFSYLFRDYGIEEGVSIEEKPGISPSAGQIQKVANQIKNDGTDLIVATDDTPVSTLNKVKEYSGVPYVILPRGFNLERNVSNYPQLYNEILKLIAANLKK
jgi:zinc/manganese transport system substrate-binding protein